jgi:hypothetical protein
MPLPKWLKGINKVNSFGVRAVNNNPNGTLGHEEQDHKRLANAVLEQAVKDLRSNDAEIYGPAWDFLTGATEEDQQLRSFWAANARMDPNILNDWAHRYETRKVKEYQATRLAQ